MAWAAPVIAVGAAAPAFASSPNDCVPSFEVIPELSAKCCNGRVKNMKVTFKITDVNNCLSDTDLVCVISAEPSTPNESIGDVVIEGSGCTTDGGNVTIYLLDVSNCTVNLTISYAVEGGQVRTAEIKSGNIPSGNSAGDCQPAS